MGKAKSRRAAAVSKPATTIAKPVRTKNHRTAQTPFEKSRPDEVYEVERVLAERYDGALRCHSYLVKWKGYPRDEDDTWEPLCNLVEATEAVNEFIKTREQENRARVAAVLEKKAAAKKASADEVARRAQLAEEAAAAVADATTAALELRPEQCLECP